MNKLPTMVDDSKPVAVSVANPMTMLAAAVERGASIDVLTKLMDLQERWEATQARKEFDNAIAAAKSEIKPIPKNREGHGGRRYADMAGIASVIDPILANHGLSYRFRSVPIDRGVNVICRLSHRAGHAEENGVPGPVDTSGSKNPIQSIGSTLTYLQRYTLTMALGLSFEDNPDEDDGESAPKIVNGWPQGSIHKNGDYADGVPEKKTKPPQTANFSRDAYVKLRAEIEAHVHNGVSPQEFLAFGSEIEERTRTMAKVWVDLLRNDFGTALATIRHNWQEAQAYREAQQAADELKE